MMRNSINSYLTTLVMVLAMLVLPTALFAQTAYLDEKGSLKTLEESATAITSSMTTWSAGWYVVSDNVTIDERITVNGDVHLILADGATLTASKGITVSASANFNVYAQSMAEATMGELVASATSADETSAAGIGGVMQLDAGEVTINGGKIKAVGKNQSAGIGSGALASVGTITINGGIVYANDNVGRAAGIGSGVLGIAGIINLNGGVIYSQGIGAGQSGKNVPITVNISDKVKKIVATPTFKGMCIGKGQSASGSVNIVFKNSENEVTGDEKDAVFYDSGEGDERIIRSKAMNHNVVISDDIKTEVAASTKYAFAGETVSLNISVAVDASSLLINGGSVALTNAEDGLYTFVMPDGDANVSAGTIDTYSVKIPEQMEIVSTSNPADGDGKYISGTIVEFRLMFPYTTTDVSDGTNTLVAANGIYSVTVGTSDINVTATIEHNSLIDLSEAPNNFIAVDGHVFSGSTQYTVIVADKANITLSGATINGGIICDGSATITLVGTNNVRGAMNMAGIQVGGEGTTLTIRGNGFLNASGDNQSAGIGLSRAWNPESDVVGGDIVIEGGTITAIGGSEWGAGIGTGVIRGELDEGRGKNVRVGNITIKGGVVKVIGGEDADGIGTGYTYYGSKNEIGTVTIYDDVDVVDASSIKNGESIIYIHDDGLVVTEYKNDYFTIIEDGERKTIYQKMSVADIESQVYTGEAITPKPTVTIGSLDITEDVDYKYSYSNNVYAGIVTVTVTFLGKYDRILPVSKTFEITKATPTVEPPTSANPKYAGACVALVTAGSTNFGTMLYSLDDDDDYSENIPCADKGGDYTVYYKVEESDNWLGAAGSVEIQVPVRVDVSVVGDGSVSGYDPDEFYPVGTVLTLTAEPADGYKFLSWNSDVDVPATFEYTVDAEQNSLEATFSNRYIAYTTSDGEIDWPMFSDTYDIKKNMCEDGLCVMFFGEGITEIDALAFSQRERLTSIEIPSSIETIGDDAFSFTPLIRVDMKSKVPPQLGDWAFDAVPDEFLIHVPHGSADAYRSANGWKDYKDHIVDHDASMLVWNDDAVVPTCTETGWEAGYVCNECHKRFADVDGHVEMSPVAALGTTYGAACIYNDDSKAFIDGMSSEFIDRDEADGREITGDVTISRHFVAKKYSTIVLPFETRTGDVPGFSFYSFKKVEKVNGVWKNVVFGYVDEKQDGDKVIEANTPYIVVADNDMDALVVKNGVVLDLRTPEPETLLGEEDSDWQFVGTYNYRQWDSDHNVKEIGTTYGFAGAEGDNTETSIGTFGKVKDGAYIYPMRAYLYYAGGNSGVSRSMAPALFKAVPAVASIDELPESMDVVIRGEEGTTVIGTINTRTGEFRSAENRWFDLNGRFLGNKKPTVKGTYYNNGKKVIVK